MWYDMTSLQCCMLWDRTSHVAVVVFTASALLCHFISRWCQKTTCLLSATPSDIKQCSIAQLAHLPAKVLHLHLLSTWWLVEAKLSLLNAYMTPSHRMELLTTKSNPLAITTSSSKYQLKHPIVTSTKLNVFPFHPFPLLQCIAICPVSQW